MDERRAFADQAVNLLMPLGLIRARAMFGCFGIYRDDLMFALVASDRLYLKVDEETTGRFRDAGCEPFVYDRKSEPIEMSYWSVPAGALEDPAALLAWGELGLAAAQRARARNVRGRGRRRATGRGG